MKYHKKLTRTALQKYNWQQILMMAASEFSRADSLFNNGKGKELENCYLRAKELIGVLEIDDSIPPHSALTLLKLTRTMKNLDPGTLYNQAMQLAT